MRYTREFWVTCFCLQSQMYGVCWFFTAPAEGQTHIALAFSPTLVQRSLLNDGSVSRGFLPKFAMFLWNSSGKESICSNPRVALESLCSADREGLKRHY